MASGGPGGEPGPDGGEPGPAGGGGGPGADEGKDREVPGPRPADALKLVMFAVLNEADAEYFEVDEHRKMNCYMVYVYNQWMFQDRWTDPGRMYFEQLRGGDALVVDPDKVQVVEAMVEFEKAALDMLDGSDSETFARAGIIHDVVETVTVLRRDRWNSWVPPRIKMS